jgi:hypothetical protein
MGQAKCTDDTRREILFRSGSDMRSFLGFLSPKVPLVADTSLSRFVRHASSGEKKKVYARVIAKATEDQKKVLEAAKVAKTKEAVARYV